MGGASGTTINIEKVNSTDAYSQIQESLEETKGQDKSAVDSAQQQNNSSSGQSGMAELHQPERRMSTGNKLQGSTA